MTEQTNSNVAPTSAVEPIRLGSRGSVLARWQTDHVADLLRAAWPDRGVEISIFTTRGDRILDTPLPQVGGKGLFTAELEEALRAGSIDGAVHSLKDLPTENPEGLTVGAIPQRATPWDVLVSCHGFTLESLPLGSAVGTSSPRRAAQLRHARPDLQILDIRGNVDSRVAKALDPHGPYAAIVLAHAGLERLGHLQVISQVLDPEQMLPAPGQGALAVQCRADSDAVRNISPLNHDPSRWAVNAERAFLAHLGGGCAVPISAYGWIEADQLFLRGRVTASDGSHQIDVLQIGPVQDGLILGQAAAQQALAQGAGTLLGEKL